MIGSRSDAATSSSADAPIGLDAFLVLAKKQRVVPVSRAFMSDIETPVSAFSKLADGEVGFLLESVEQGERWSRFSFVGRRPLGTILRRDGEIVTSGMIPLSPMVGEGILSFVERLLALLHVDEEEGEVPLRSGLVGYFGYDVVGEIEELPRLAPDDLHHDETSLQLIGDLAVFDHWRQRVHLVANVLVGHDDEEEELRRTYEGALSRIALLADDLAKESSLQLHPLVGDEEEGVVEFVRNTTAAEYRSAVEVAKEHILAGDIFQVVLSQRFEFCLDVEPIELYRVLRQVNPSPYMYFLDTGSTFIVGSSPEALVKVEGRKVITRPIAGTRRRGRSAQDDRRLAAELAEHPKEIAEHVMLVDLARNDLGRVVVYGSESVDELMTLEFYSHVMHMTSQVSGELRPEFGPVDVLRATLPAGTLSGAPKVRAMEIIDQLEVARRGAYGGVVGYLDFSGNMDVAITIRTAVVERSGRAFIQAGAGVVADSDPALEDLECSNKARALLAAAWLANSLHDDGGHG